MIKWKGFIKGDTFWLNDEEAYTELVALALPYIAKKFGKIPVRWLWYLSFIWTSF